MCLLERGVVLCGNVVHFLCDFSVSLIILLKIKCIKRNKITICFILTHLFPTVYHILLTVGFEEYKYFTHFK